MRPFIFLFLSSALASPSSSNDVPKTTPSDTVSNCAAWVVAEPLDNCESLAERHRIPLDQFLRYNPSLKSDCSTNANYSYCVETTLGEESQEQSPKELFARATVKPDQMGEVIKYLFLVRATKPLLPIIQRWDNKVGTLFRSLSYADFSDWLLRSAEGAEFQIRMDATNLGYYFACHLREINDKVANWLKSKKLVCICYGTNCCKSDESCPNPNFRRLARSPRNLKRGSQLVPRAPYTFSGTRNGVTYSGSYTAIDWPGPTDFGSGDWIWQHVFAGSLDDDCVQLAIQEYTFNDVRNYVNRVDPGYDEWDFAQVEHWVEKNMIAKFASAVINQQLASGRAFQNAANIPPTFFTQFMTTNQAALLNTPTVPGAQSQSMPAIRIMHTLGSKRYTSNFLLMQGTLNNLKEGILRGDDPVANSSIQSTMTNAPRVFITHLRNVFNVISYLNDALALEKGEETLKAIRWEWYQYQQLYNPFVGYTPDVVAAWDEWYLDYMQTRLASTRQWLMNWALDGLTHWETGTDAMSTTIATICDLYYNRAYALGGYNDLSYPRGTPTAPP